MPAESVSQLLALVDSHTLLMSDLIEDLLTVCHLEAGDVQIYSSAVKVANVVTPVVESLRKLEETPDPGSWRGPRPGGGCRRVARRPGAPDGGGQRHPLLAAGEPGRGVDLGRFSPRPLRGPGPGPGSQG